MEAYYSDGRGRYGTGEDYDWFQKFGDDEDYEVFTSLDELWTYDCVENGIELLRYNGREVDIIVPAVVDGKNVVALDSTFDGFYELKSAVIPKGVISIVGAFYGCEGLENVTLPEGIEDMTYAFNCCYSLKNIDVPSSVKNFSWAFEGTAIESFRFPQGTETIASSFIASEHLRRVFIPKSVTDLMEAFADCAVLEYVEIENGLQSIDDYAFFHCLSLKEMIIPESVTEFGEKSIGIMEIREYTDPEQTAYRMRGVTVVPDFKIKGTRGSAAERYAKQKEIKFINMEDK